MTLDHVVGDFNLKDRYLLRCPSCHGAGCMECRGNGQIPVYIIETGSSLTRCRLFGHKLIGSIERAKDAKELPLIVWCLRTKCTWRRIQTDVPEAYGMQERYDALPDDEEG